MQHQIHGSVLVARPPTKSPEGPAGRGNNPNPLTRRQAVELADTLEIVDYDNDGQPIYHIDDRAEAEAAYEAHQLARDIEQANDYEEAQFARDIADNEARIDRAAFLTTFLRTA